MMLPLPSQRIPLKAVVAGSWRPLAAPMSVKLMPSVVVATRMVMTSVFGPRIAGVDIGECPARGGRTVVGRRRGLELLFDIDDSREAVHPNCAEEGVRAREAGRRPGRGLERRVAPGCERAHVTQLRKRS